MLMWAAFKSLGVWIQIAIVVAILAAFAGGIWYIHHSIYQSGYRAAEEKLKPQIQKLEQDLKNVRADLDQAVGINATFQAENKRLADLARQQTMQLDALAAKAIEAQNQARDALARVAANQKRYSAEIARLQAILNGPPMTEGDSEEADSILRSVLRDRLSIDPRAEAPGGGNAAQGGGGEGRGTAAVHRQGSAAAPAVADQDRPENRQPQSGGSRGSARPARAG